MKKYIILTICVLFLVSVPVFFKFNQNRSTTWFSVDPIQCLGNPWEFDWLQKNNGNYSAYPKSSKQDPGPVNKQISNIIKNYYNTKYNTEILNIKTKSFEELGKGNQVCSACSCPQGYTLYIQVSNENAQILKENGWSESREQF